MSHHSVLVIFSAADRAELK